MENLIPEKYREDDEIIRLTIEQIKKDFGPLLPELILTGNKKTVFEELNIQLTGLLKKIHKSDIRGFQNLLYRVDIPESSLPPPSGKFYSGLSVKIIQREFQKVLIRKFLSKKG